MTNKKYRKIVFHQDYFEKFFVKQRPKVQDKIIWTFDLIEDVQNVPKKYLKHITNSSGLYEIRVQQGSDIFRIFCFFDGDSLVVTINGFQKKSQKTPTNEMKKAEKIKLEYEQEKEK